MTDAVKILVFSDSHTDVETMIVAAQNEAPDAVLHLGDHVEDALLLRQHLPGVPLYMVKGNTDNTVCEDEQILLLNGKRLLMCHGHKYNVKTNFAEIIRKGKNEGVDIALFGHTHEPLLWYCDSFWLMNPGRAGRSASRRVHTSYGVIRISQSIRAEIVEVHGPLAAISHGL